MPEESSRERARLVRAMAETVALEGYAAASVEAVSAYAGLSPEAFLRHWRDVEACFLEAFDDLCTQVSVRMLVAVGQADCWERQVAAATSAVLGWCEQDPLGARAILFESVAVSTRVAWRLSRALDRLAELMHAGGVRAGGQTLECAAAPPPALARALVRSAHASLHDAMQSRRPGAETRLIDLAPGLISMIVLPYAGARIAAREFARTGGV